MDRQQKLSIPTYLLIEDIYNMKMSNCKLKRYQRLSLLEYHIHISIYTCVLITLKTKTDNTIKTTPIIIIEKFWKKPEQCKKDTKQ